MRKKLVLSMLVCGLLFTMTACGNYAIPDPAPPGSAGKTDDPFAAVEETMEFLGAITHGAANPNRDAAQNVLPYEYEGGEFAFEYHFTAEGGLSDVGFLLFLDGKPQAYKIDDTNAEYEYCHSFSIEGSRDGTFTFLFTPQSGVMGDTLHLTVLSITNPSFQPDMKDSSSFGWYQKPLEHTVKLHFQVDASQEGIGFPKTKGIFSSVQVKQEKTTSAFLENELIKYGWSDVSMDTLDDRIYFTASYNGEIVYDNICLSNHDTTTVRYTLCGTPGAVYRVSFFIDHLPVSLGGDDTYEAVLRKGTVWSMEATFDTNALEGFHTFYIVAVPTSGSNDFPAQKSDSILLYKEK